MTEGWVDCPALGPGWQRREVLRKNGTRPGQSDTYYTSPRGEKIRSRVELLRLLGGSRDLTDFDFKKGIYVDPSAEPQLLQPLPPTGGGHQRVKKGSKRHLPPLAAATPPLKKPPDLQVFEEPPDKEVPDQKPPQMELELPVEAPAAILAEQQELLVAADQPAMKPHKRRCRKQLPALFPPGKMGNVTVEEANPEEPVVLGKYSEGRKARRSLDQKPSYYTPPTSTCLTRCCASCQGQFPGVMLPSQRRCRWLCPDCRAQRRDFNREQRYYKQIGCGVCQACQMSQDCGICSVCVLRAKSPELRIGIKCLLRRCLKIVKKGLECGMCQACKITEDCGSCHICLRRQKPGMKRQWKCLKRRCLKRKKKIPPKKDGYSMKKLTIEVLSTEETFTPARRRQKKSAPVTDGPAPKVQRAPRGHHKRLPAAPPASADGPLPKAQLAASCHRRKRSATTKWKPTMERDPGGIPTVRQRKKQLGAVKERKKPGRPPKHPTAQLKNNVQTSASRRNRKCGKCEACLLKMDCGRCDFCCDKPKFGGRNLKRQKCRWRQCLHFAMVSAGLPQCKRGRGAQGKELVVLDDEDDEEVEHLQQLRPPVIMEIYSLGGAQPLAQLDSVLHEFLAELNEIPLPAHWEVLSPLCGPDLRLVQRSEHSTMSSAVIYIRPGLFFHVVVRNLPVPPEHELYASHPARLTTVDEVVELICDLEAYRLCSGWPAGWHAGERSEACDVLVYSGCCPQCQLNPWPSGRGTR
ncbi:methyl-CpG-binding domain protein 1 isoform X17 [Podarcis raffonei]|uniref:methyl-CpG-binding domain protein 1 isoform X17 n=1 Tax=Podarcis raffonei TaxID=65483 RepID=UPI00232958C0|nr:methyl-CpG-binding domain protein 1 isoform X17 [Podarcis raffonei]